MWVCSKHHGIVCVFCSSQAPLILAISSLWIPPMVCVHTSCMVDVFMCFSVSTYRHYLLEFWGTVRWTPVFFCGSVRVFIRAKYVSHLLWNFINFKFNLVQSDQHPLSYGWNGFGWILLTSYEWVKKRGVRSMRSQNKLLSVPQWLNTEHLFK